MDLTNSHSCSTDKKLDYCACSIFQPQQLAHYRSSCVFTARRDAKSSMCHSILIDPCDRMHVCRTCVLPVRQNKPTAKDSIFLFWPQ